MRRHRYLAAAVAAATVLLTSGCLGMGGDDSAEAPLPAATVPAGAAAPVAVTAATLGGPVRAAAGTPKDVTAALKGDDVVVIAFVVKNAADDQSVSAAVDAVRADRRSRADARFFVYTVGTDKFGDLADLLGVSGTPAVAVIGRDRNLTNLFSGLVDAEILRQAISDAADTAAANPGAAADADTPDSTPAKGATGSAEGIALAKKVNAAYRDVPGVRGVGTFEDDDFGTGDGTMDVALSKGLATGSSISAKFDGFTMEVVQIGGTAYVRAEGSACWASAPASKDDDITNEPMIELKGRFSAPTTSGGITTLKVATTNDGEPQKDVYSIDTATNRVASVTSDGELTTLTLLDTTPSIVAPTEKCASPEQAFADVPSSVPSVKNGARDACRQKGSSDSRCSCIADELVELYPTAGEMRSATQALIAGEVDAIEDLAEVQKSCPLP